MPERARTPSCPSLPPEIWIRILSFNPDLTHLWISCRHTSRNFRAYTEQVFAETVIRATFIDFHLEKYNLGGKSKRPEIPTSFSHFELGVKLEDGGREKGKVWFKDKRRKSEIGGGKKKEYERIVERWEGNVRGWRAQMPNFTVRIESMVNDTELPGLEMDVLERKIGFDWRRMYTLFFREQALFRTLKGLWQTETDAQMHRNNVRIAKNEKLSIADYPLPWPAAEIEIRKQIRRKRLSEHFASNEEMLWAISSLAHFENHGASGGSGKAFKLNPDLPGAGIGEKWFGSMNSVQELYLDEWSCMHRIDTKMEHVKGEEVFPRYSVPPPDLKEERQTTPASVLLPVGAVGLGPQTYDLD
ncbi:hypothetical protein P280DRAFT_453605 [Massarina eburnea CBS 473.64]|uniref:F-box domain-containing protein n=1 Tax=Massarina eburnea CBS 473.64 TaxID=1395130 RepID=A0A6A6RWX3_9PLEO|nr:hypothetical protein P280DRAFT_453605 [Massarina eburnea CBS 473.64]